MKNLRNLQTFLILLLVSCPLLSQTLQFDPTETWLSSDFFYSGSKKFVKDVNGDGKADLIAITSSGVYIRKSSGSQFLNSENWFSQNISIQDKLFIEDVNGDSMADFIWIKDENKDKVYVRLSNGSNYERPNWTLWMEQGTLAIGTPMDESESLIGCTFFGDVDGNGYKDLIIGLLGGSNVYLNTGTEFIKENSSTWFEDGSFAYCQQEYFGDIDGDGKDDLLTEFKFNIDGSTSADESYLMVHRSNGQEFLPTEFHWEGTGDSRYDNTHIMFYGDFNEDGLTDLYFSGSKVKLSLGNRYSDYQDWSDLPSGFGLSHVADVTGDGKDDIVGWNQDGIFVRPVGYKGPTITGLRQYCVGDEVTFQLQEANPNSVITWSYPSNNMYVIAGQGTSEITLSSFSAGTYKTVGVNVQYDGLTFEDNHTVLRIFHSGEIPSTPTIQAAPDSPSNLLCCGVQQNFKHASLYSYTLNREIEWQPIIYSANSEDIYGFSTTTEDMMVFATKNSYSPLVLGAKARILSLCEVPSEWSNEITRYYGTTSSSSFTSLGLTSNLESINDYAPIREFYSNINNTLHIEFIDVLEWLEIKYSGVDLKSDDISRIKYFLNNRLREQGLTIEIFDINGFKLFNKKLKKSQIMKLSKLNTGVYIIKFAYLEAEFEKKIIVN